MAFDAGLADRVRIILARLGPFSERKMFGGLCFLVNGNMCCGIMKNDLMLRLTPDAAAQALKQPHTRPMDFTGKPIPSMLYIAPAGLDSDHDLEAWVHTAVKLARARPPKPEKTQTPRR